MRINQISLSSLILFLVALSSTHCKMNNNIFDPKLLINKEIPISRLEAAGHRFAIPSTDQTYQISGDVYESHSIADQKQIYNISNYKKSQSCTYFKSIVEMNSLQGQNINFIALKSLVSEQTKQLFVIGMTDEFQSDKKFLRIYQFQQSNFTLKSQLSFDRTQLSQDINVQIFITRINNTILFSDGNFLYKLKSIFNTNKNQTEYQWIKVQGWNTGKQSWKGQEFLGLDTVIFQDRNVVMFLYTEKIVFYEYTESTNAAKIYLEISNSINDAFQDVQIGFNNSQVYVIAGNKLLLYSLPDYSKPVISELAGQRCTRIYIYKTTYHIICEYEKRNFVGEYFYNDTDDSLVLNRFYNDIENYRLLSYVNNYLLMIGENDVILTSNGVNRKALLDMPKNAYSERFVSFGIETIHQLNKLENSQNRQVLFAVGEDFIVLFQLKFVPAEVWCYIERPPESLQKSIMIVRNTSQCELNEKRQTLKSYCINLKPVQIYFQHYEIESKVTSIIVIIAILLAFVVAFLCLGCVFRQNMNYNNLVFEIKNKIKKLQKKPEQQLRQL